MLQIPTWKRVLILGIVLVGLLYAMPNLFYQRVETHNDAITAAERAGFETPEQAAARSLWPDWLPSSLVNLGLDLRGGARFPAIAGWCGRPSRRARPGTAARSWSRPVR